MRAIRSSMVQKILGVPPGSLGPEVWDGGTAVAIQGAGGSEILSATSCRAARVVGTNGVVDFSCANGTYQIEADVSVYDGALAAGILLLVISDGTTTLSTTSAAGHVSLQLTQATGKFRFSPVSSGRGFRLDNISVKKVL